MSASENATLGDLSQEAVRATQAAAVAASAFVGRRDRDATNVSAINGMRQALNAMHIEGTVTFGEGVQGVAPMLYTGERVGQGGGPRVDIALDAVDGATSTARGGYNAISVLAMARDGGFLNLPDLYLKKIAVGPGLPEGVVDLDDTPANNVRNLARAKGVEPSDLLVCVLDRPRHDRLCHKLIMAGVRIMCIPDGDISGVIAAALNDNDIDMYMGIGGGPEGVLAAAAMNCLGGQMQARLVIRGDSDREVVDYWGLSEPERKFGVTDLAWGDLSFAATGVTAGTVLRGVRRRPNQAVTHSLVADSSSRHPAWIDAEHPLATS